MAIKKLQRAVIPIPANTVLSAQRATFLHTITTPQLCNITRCSFNTKMLQVRTEMPRVALWGQLLKHGCTVYRKDTKKPFKLSVSANS